MKTKALKAELIKGFNEKFKTFPFVALADFQGMTVAESRKLRKDLRNVEADCKVVRNSLMRIAYRGTPVEQLADKFVGPTAIVFSQNPVEAAKVLNNFMDEKDAKLKFKAAVLEGKVVDADMFKRLATLPSRQELISQLAFSLKYPVNAVAWSLENIMKKLVYALENIKEKKAA